MKRLILMLSIILFLMAGCGSDSLNTFTKDFNKSARKYDVPELIEDEYGDIETEDGESWRVLYDSKDYEIEALYEKKKLNGYTISADFEGNELDKNSKGYNAILTLADSLKLDKDKLESNMRESIKDDELKTYKDGDYNIRVFSLNLLRATVIVTITF